MKMEELKKVKKLRINDDSQLEPETCNNGGAYGFWTDYTRLDNGFEVSYGTTAEFDFCPVCGSFNNHSAGDESPFESGYECGEFEVISEEDMLKLLNEFHETDTEYIEILEQE